MIRVIKMMMSHDDKCLPRSIVHGLETPPLHPEIHVLVASKISHENWGLFLACVAELC